MTTVIIPAAGLATRLRPISNFTSKSMIPVNGKPAISYILDQIKDWATDIRIVYGKSDDIINYCSKVYSHLPISFYKQEDPLGPLHAIYCGLSHLDSLSSDDAVVWLGDTIVLDYNHSKAISECSIVYHEVPDWDRWCLIDDKGNLFDKPVQDPGTDRALVGIYQFNSLSKMSILVDDIISSNETVKGEYQISQLLDCYRNKEQVKTNEWYDCGDFPSLYESRARLLNRLSRDDNQLYVDTISGTITKSGKRCRSEIEWYKEAPKKLLPFIPTIYEIDNESYTMEFCPGTSLQDIFVYENLKEDTVNYTLDKILTVYNKCFEQQITRSNKSSIYMWIDKNLERFNNYDKYAFIDKQDLLLVKNVVKSESYHDLIKGNNFVNNIHGDLHFGNILFDYNTGKVKFIDPRGNWNNTIINNGDLEYDIAKLYQSVYGEYMWIVNQTKVNSELKNLIINKLDQYFTKFDTNKIKLLSIIMMASCLPFHSDNLKRQELIWNTSIKLLKEHI